MAIGGDQFSADIKKIESDFKDTIKNLESLGADSTAIQKLINAKKAQAEMQYFIPRAAVFLLPHISLAGCDLHREQLQYNLPHRSG